MTTQPLTEPVALDVPPLPRAALDELYHFLQYLQFKYEVDLELTLEALEDEIDGFDGDVALQESGEISLASLKQELCDPSNKRVQNESGSSSSEGTENPTPQDSSRKL